MQNILMNFGDVETLLLTSSTCIINLRCVAGKKMILHWIGIQVDQVGQWTCKRNIINMLKIEHCDGSHKGKQRSGNPSSLRVRSSPLCCFAQFLLSSALSWLSGINVSHWALECAIEKQGWLSGNSREPL